MGWIDAHCHLADPRFADGLDAALSRAETKNISLWIQGGVSPLDWERQDALKARYPGKILTSYGLHPWWVSEVDELTAEQAILKLRESLNRADAFGELGLDFGKRFADPKIQSRQELYFERQLEFASHSKLPLILHVVQAHSKAVEILKRFPHPDGGLIHSFSGSVEEAKNYLDLGFTLSISGVVCRKGYEKLKKALQTLPRDKIVIETDAPDQNPEGALAGLNEPENLLKIADAVAQIQNKTRNEVLDQSTENLKRVFKL